MRKQTAVVFLAKWMPTWNPSAASLKSVDGTGEKKRGEGSFRLGYWSEVSSFVLEFLFGWVLLKHEQYSRHEAINAWLRGGGPRVMTWWQKGLTDGLMSFWWMLRSCWSRCAQCCACPMCVLFCNDWSSKIIWWSFPTNTPLPDVACYFAVTWFKSCYTSIFFLRQAFCFGWLMLAWFSIYCWLEAHRRCLCSVGDCACYQHRVRLYVSW